MRQKHVEISTVASRRNQGLLTIGMHGHMLDVSQALPGIHLERPQRLFNHETTRPWSRVYGPSFLHGRLQGNFCARHPEVNAVRIRPKDHDMARIGPSFNLRVLCRNAPRHQCQERGESCSRQTHHDGWELRHRVWACCASSYHASPNFLTKASLQKSNTDTFPALPHKRAASQMGHRW